ncbi:MAG: cadmium-translocating P-type ATPase [Candidatus Altiarchaeota archaeon]|nr:cadmium-translocating P-type ATPase [Candidatus Altiarchaeota archaeon]
MVKKPHEEDLGCSSCNVSSKTKEPQWKRKNILISLIAGTLLSVGLYFEFFANQYTAAQFLFLAVVLVAGREIIRKGLLSAWRKQLNINVLISIATAGAFMIGHGEEGAAVVFLFFIAEFLEDYAADRARESMASLLKLAPKTATIKRGKKEITLRIEEVKVGDIVILKPGDRIPVDGIVVSGVSSVNQAPITGESMVVSKAKGDPVFAGTTNEEGYLEVRVTKESDETLLSRIVELVEDAQKKKSTTEAFIDRFSKSYTPIIIVLALAVMTIPTLVFGLPFNEWFYRGLVLLVVSCPCALAISTPISMVSGITSAARNGVIIKGGNFVEEIKNAKVIVFDKTGTLTEGKLELTDIVTLNNNSEESLLKIVASLESKSKHPLAKVIVENARERGIKLKKVHNFKSITGKGVKGKIGGRIIYAGNRSLFKEMKVKLPLASIDRLEGDGKTTVIIGSKRQLIGVVALMDKVRDNSRKVIEELKHQGIRTVMLTGDNERVARFLARKLSIDEYYAELLPEDKVKKIDQLLNDYEHVVMVGDGVNDAPALAKAHVGIAMGTIGSDVAIETADIALMKDDLSKVNYLISLSKRTMSIVKQNVTASLLIKGLFAALAIPGFMPLWLAVAVGDMGLSLAVIANALRIGNIKDVV